MSIISPQLLRVAVSQARLALLDIDTRDVPGTLRKVAVQTGKRLPLPMARRLLEEIEVNEWFRSIVAEGLELSDNEDLQEEAAWLFLNRPDGWGDRLAKLAELMQESAEEDEADRLVQRVTALEAELDASRNRAKRSQREFEMAKTEAEQRVTAARSSARAGRKGEHQALEVAKREIATLTEQLVSMTTDRDEAKTRLKQIRQELLRERRADRPADIPPPRSVWAELDAVGAARLLDEVTIALAPPPSVDQPVLPMEFEPMVLPKGLPPDDRAAIDWLLRRADPFVLIVDGYNVSFLLEPDRFNASESRRRLDGDLARLRRLAGTPLRIVVVYDSKQTGGISSDTAAGGIDVRFTTADHTADDEILVLATELGGSAVVVSSDRRVREGAEKVGALGLWSEALVGWIKGV